MFMPRKKFRGIGKNMETLRKLLDVECCYRMKGETMDRFLELMTEEHYKRNQPLVDYNELNSNIYIVKEGIVRIAYWDGFKEKTFAFALPGTVLIACYSFCMNSPSFSRYEACCDAVIMKVTKERFLELANESNDFAKWMMFMSMTEIAFLEKKREVVNGDAKERFEALIMNRPEIVKNVSSKIIASYIGITPIYLSKLKREFAHLLKK